MGERPDPGPTVPSRGGGGRRAAGPNVPSKVNHIQGVVSRDTGVG